jgi:hypothetical protein
MFCPLNRPNRLQLHGGSIWPSHSRLATADEVIEVFLLRCMSLLLAQSGNSPTEDPCPLLGVKRTLRGWASMYPLLTQSGHASGTTERLIMDRV